MFSFVSEDFRSGRRKRHECWDSGISMLSEGTQNRLLGYLKERRRNWEASGNRYSLRLIRTSRSGSDGSISRRSFIIILRDLAVHLGTMGAGIGPRISEIFGVDRRVGGEEGRVSRALAALRFEQPDRDASAEDAGLPRGCLRSS